MSLKGWHACEMTPEAGERIEAGAKELYNKLSSEENRLRSIESLVRSWLPATTINTPTAWDGNLKFSSSGGSMFLPMDGAMQQIALNMAYKPPWSTSPPTSLATFPMGIFIAAFQYTLKGAAAVQLGVDPHTLQSGPLRELFGGDNWASKVKSIAEMVGATTDQKVPLKKTRHLGLASLADKGVQNSWMGPSKPVEDGGRESIVRLFEALQPRLAEAAKMALAGDVKGGQAQVHECLQSIKQ